MEDVGDASPAKKSCNKPVLELWEAGANFDTITQDTSDINNCDISATNGREDIEDCTNPNTRETPIDTIVHESLSRLRQSLSRQAKAKDYHPLERALPAQFDQTHFDKLPPELLAFISQSSPTEPFEPRTYRQAMGGSDFEKWDDSMTEEIDLLLENDTWELVDRPKDRDVLSER
jgi:hypothetical protein